MWFLKIIAYGFDIMKHIYKDVITPAGVLMHSYMLKGKYE